MAFRGRCRAEARAFWEGDVSPVRSLLDSEEARGARLACVEDASVLFHRRPVAPLLALLFFSGVEGGAGGGGGGGGLSRAPALESLTVVRPRADPTDSPAMSSKGEERGGKRAFDFRSSICFCSLARSRARSLARSLARARARMPKPVDSPAFSSLFFL